MRWTLFRCETSESYVCWHLRSSEDEMLAIVLPYRRYCDIVWDTLNDQDERNCSTWICNDDEERVNRLTNTFDVMENSIVSMKKIKSIVHWTSLNNDGSKKENVIRSIKSFVSFSTICRILSRLVLLFFHRRTLAMLMSIVWVDEMNEMSSLVPIDKC